MDVTTKEYEIWVKEQQKMLAKHLQNTQLFLVSAICSLVLMAKIDGIYSWVLGVVSFICFIGWLVMANEHSNRRADFTGAVLARKMMLEEQLNKKEEQV